MRDTSATIETEENEGDLRSGSRKINLANCVCFFDFDNTITTFDVLDGIIKRFAKDKNWVKLEEDWRAGKIGSRQCLSGQLKSVKVAKKELLSYLDSVKIDKSFCELLRFLKKNKAEIAILSDSFSFVINYILKKHKIGYIKTYANHLRLKSGELAAIFPHVNETCFRCANCKKSHLGGNGFSKRFSIYIGDGLSDVCPAQHTNLTFAKATLLSHLQKKNKHCIEFKHLADVYNYLKEVAQ